MGLFFGIESDSSGVVKDLSKIGDKAHETTDKVVSDFEKMNSIISKNTGLAANLARRAFDTLSKAVSGAGMSVEQLQEQINSHRESLHILKNVLDDLSRAGVSKEALSPIKAYLTQTEGIVENLEIKLSLINTSTGELMGMLSKIAGISSVKDAEEKISSIQKEMSGLNIETSEGISRFMELQKQLVVLSEVAKRLSTEGFNADGLVSDEVIDKVDSLAQKMENLNEEGKNSGEDFRAASDTLSKIGDIASDAGEKLGTAVGGAETLSKVLSTFKKGGKGGIWGVLAVGAIEGIKAWIASIKKAREEAERLRREHLEDIWAAQSNVVAKSSREYAHAKTELEEYLHVARNAEAPLIKQKEAYDALNKAVPGFNSQLDNTADGYTRNTKALEEYLKKLDILYKYEAAKDYLEELYAQQVELEVKKGRFEKWLANRNRILDDKQNDLERASEQAYSGNILSGPDAGMASRSYALGSTNAAKRAVSEARENANAAAKGVSDVNRALGRLNTTIAETQKIRDGLVNDGALEVQPYGGTGSASSGGHSRGGSGGGYANDDTAERLRREREDAERLAELRANQALYAERDARDQELARWQAEIDAMDEGLEKKLQQIKLNYAKEEEAIKREQEDLILQRRDDAKALWEAENPEAVRNGETWQSSGAAANYKGGLNSSDNAYFKARTEANNKQLETSTRDLFKGLIDQYQDYTAERLAIEKKFNDDISALMAARKQAEERGDVAELIRINGAIDTASKSRNAKLQSTDAQKWAKDNGLDAFFGNLSGQSGKALRAMRDRLNARSENATGDGKADLQRRAKEIDDALMTRRIGNAQYASQQAGEAADLVSKLDEQGIFGGGDAGKRIGAAFDAAASAGEAYAKFMQGDFVGALSSGLDAVLDLFTVFGIGQGNMAELQDEIDHLTGATQDLTESFNQLKENLKEGNTLTARENYEKAKANVLQREQNMRQTMSDRLRQWELGSRSLGAKVNGNSSAQRALAQMGLSSIYDLISLSPERIQQLKADHAGGAWTTLMDALMDANNKHNGDAEAFINELDQLAGLKDEMEELTDEFQEKVTGISFEGFKGNFVSMLQDLSKDIDDFAADTEDQFNKISVQRIADKYEGELRALYDDWAEAAKDGLTEEERRSLEARKADIAQRALDERQAAIASGLISTSAERKAGSTKGFGSMNSEQADELNGRFTALQVSNQGILNSVVQSAASLAAMSGSLSASAETLQSLQMLAVARNSHLEDISAFCKNISARVDAIEGYSKTTSEKL